MNIILIVIDALRAKNLGCYGFKEKISPNIDKLAKNGVLFENAFSCTVVTIPSLTSIFSGMYPISHGIIRQHYTQQDVSILNSLKIKFLPEILHSMGYTTLALDWIGNWLKRGYDFYYGMPKSKVVETSVFKKALQIVSYVPPPVYNLIKSVWRRIHLNVLRVTSIENAEVFTNLAINLIRENSNNEFFLFIHYWDTHVPYNAPRDFIEPVDEGKDIKIEKILGKIANPQKKAKIRSFTKGLKTANELIAKYYGAIRYVDYQIGILLDALKDMDILDDTLIILTSDHGESLIEHEIYFSHHGLYDETIRVPLIFSGPRIPRGKRIANLVQHVDIMPTILDILKTKSDRVTLDGKSLVPLLLEEDKLIRPAIYVEEADLERKLAIRTSNYKYIYAPSKSEAVCKECGRIHGALEELYDLQKDPSENHNIAEFQPEIVKNLKNNLFTWLKYMRKKREKRMIKAKIQYLMQKKRI